MNNITIAGPLGKDVEVRYTQKGEAVASFSVADSQGRDKPTIWWSCQLWGKRVESLSPYLTKGQQVTVSGSVSEQEWTDKDGQKRKNMQIRVNDVALQGGREKATGIAPHPASAKAQGQQAPQKPAGSGFDDMDDDIPF